MCRTVALIIGACAVAVAVCTLIGWSLRVQWLTDWGIGIPMFVNTGVMMLTSAVALMVQAAGLPWQRGSQWLACVPLGIAAATAFEHLTGVSLGIDTLLVAHPWGTRAATEPGRPGLPATLAFLLLGTALLLGPARGKGRLAVPILGAAVAGLGGLPLVGYLLGAEPLFSVAGYTGVALPTASMTCALGVAMLLTVPDLQPMTILLEDSTAGLLMRRTLPFVLALPLGLGWVFVKAHRAHWFDTAFGAALFVLTVTGLMVALLSWCSALVSEREAALQGKEDALVLEIGGRKRIEESLATRAREQAVLYQFTDRIHRATSLQEVIDAALDSIIAGLGCPRASILLFDSSKVMRFVGWRGLSDEYRNAVEGHSPWTTGDPNPGPVCVEDVKGANLGEALEAVVLGEGIRALAFIPVVAGGRLLGKFMTYYDRPHQFDRGEIDLAVTIARHLGFGIERRRGEEDLKRAVEEARAASRAKDDFLAALSHELRTPLTPVLMTAGALAQDESLPAPVRQQAELMRRNVQFEARLIDDLLDLTRVSRGKISITPDVTDLHELLKHTQRLTEMEAAAKTIDLRFELEAGEHHVMGDAARLQQVLSNLVTNAIKFTPPGGLVTIRSFNPTPARLAITVADNGIGIARTALSRIFGAFDQGELADRHQFGGLGLGLAIAKAIVEVHGGELRAASEGPGCGATFTLELATMPTPVGVTAPVDRKAARARAMRLLLVDDHEPTLSVLKKLLERDGHAVCAAMSVKAALEQVEGNEFDMVISDIGLPDGTGYELMKAIRGHFDWPAIALSGFGMEADRQKSSEAGFDAHIVKPVDIEQLRSVMAKVARPNRKRAKTDASGSEVLAQVD